MHCCFCATQSVAEQPRLATLHEGFHRTLAAIVGNFNATIGKNVHQIFSLVFCISYDKGEISKADLQTSRFSQLFEEIGVSHDACDFNVKYLYELGKGAFLIEGALEICKKIISAGKKIFIVTNGILATQESRIKHSLIKDHISDFFVSEFVGYQKLATEYFEYVFSKISEEKNKFLIIGDSLTADVAGGINAGIDSCWFNPGKSENNTKITPTHEISGLHELEFFI